MSDHIDRSLFDLIAIQYYTYEKAGEAVGNLEISKNANIKSLVGLEQLQAATNNVKILNNQSLEVLQGWKC
jgi:hypothetical protein